jgi:thiol-disulfide isomerase/thioredoxin
MLANCLALAFLFGCTEPTQPPPSQPPADARPAAESPPAAAPPAAATPSPTTETEPQQTSLEIKSWDETQQLVAAQKGKVVVLDLWSTWCVPCVREFPKLVELNRSRAPDVVCIAFNMDYSGAAGETPESFREPVSQFLTKQGATFPNVISSDPADDVYERLKLGSIPAVLVYGWDGQLAKRFDNDDALYGDEGFTYEKHIAPLVEQLLSTAPLP